MNIIIARPKRWIFLVVALGLSVVILANIHLVYVAFRERREHCLLQRSRIPDAGLYHPLAGL